MKLDKKKKEDFEALLRDIVEARNNILGIVAYSGLLAQLMTRADLICDMLDHPKQINSIDPDLFYIETQDLLKKIP